MQRREFSFKSSSGTAVLVQAMIVLAALVLLTIVFLVCVANRNPAPARATTSSLGVDAVSRAMAPRTNFGDDEEAAFAGSDFRPPSVWINTWRQSDAIGHPGFSTSNSRFASTVSLAELMGDDAARRSFGGDLARRSMDADRGRATSAGVDDRRRSRSRPTSTRPSSERRRTLSADHSRPPRERRPSELSATVSNSSHALSSADTYTLSGPSSSIGHDSIEALKPGRAL